MGTVPPIGRTGIPEIDQIYESWETSPAQPTIPTPVQQDIPEDILRARHKANQAEEAASWWSGFYDALKPEREDISMPSHLTAEVIRGSFGQALSGMASAFVDLPGKILSGAQNLPGAAVQAGYEGRNISDTLKAESPEIAAQIDETMNALYPVNTEMTKSFWAGDLPRGAGSLAFNLLAGPSGALTLGAVMSAGQGFKEAEEAGASFPAALGSLVSNGLLGATEAAPILGAYERVAGKLGPLAMEKILTKYADTTIAAGLAGVLEEGTQEVLQQFGSNVTAKLLYDTQRDLMEGVTKSGEVGGILGFVMNAMAKKIGHLRTSKYDKPNTRSQQSVTTDMEKRETITPQDNLGLERRLQASQEEMKYLNAVPETGTVLSGIDLDEAKLTGPTLTFEDGTTAAMNREWEPEIKAKFIQEIVKSGRPITDVTGSALDVQEYYNLLATHFTPAETTETIMGSPEEATYAATVLADLGVSAVADGNTLVLYPNQKTAREGQKLEYETPKAKGEGLTNVLEKGGTFTEQEFILPTEAPTEEPKAPFRAGWSPDYENYLKGAQDRPQLILAYEALRRHVDAGLIGDHLTLVNAQASLMEMEELIKQRHPDWAEQFKLGEPRLDTFTPEPQYGPEGLAGPRQLPLPMYTREQPTQGAPMVATDMNLTPDQRAEAAQRSGQLGGQADQILNNMIGKRRSVNQLSPKVQLMLALESEGFDPRLLSEEETDAMVDEAANTEDPDFAINNATLEQRRTIRDKINDLVGRVVTVLGDTVKMARYDDPAITSQLHGTMMMQGSNTTIAVAKGQGITTMNHEIGHHLVKRNQGVVDMIARHDLISEEGVLTGEDTTFTLDMIAEQFAGEFWKYPGKRAREEVFVRLMSSIKNIWEPQAREELQRLIAMDRDLDHVLDLARAMADNALRATRESLPNDYWAKRMQKFLHIVKVRLNPAVELVTWADTILGTKSAFVNENGKWSLDMGNDNVKSYETFSDLLTDMDQKFDFTQAPDLVGNIEREAKELGGKDFFNGLPWVEGPPRYNPEADQLGPVTQDDVDEAVNRYTRREVITGKPFKEEVTREEAKESFGSAGLTAFWRASRDWFNSIEKDMGHQVFTNIYLPLDSARIPHDRWLDQAAKKIKHLWKIPVERRVVLRDYLEAKGPDAKAEIALRNHMSDQEMQWSAEIRNLFDETFKEFGIGDAAPYVEDYMPRVMRAVYAQRAGKKSDFSPFSEPGVNETADFFAKHARTIEDAKRAATEPDAVKLLWIHMQMGAREHFMGAAWDQAVKAFKDPDLPKGIRHPIANYMNTMYGGRDYSMDAIHNWWKAIIKLPLMNRLGLTEDWIDKLVLFQYSSSLGMRPALMVRDMTQSFLSAYPHLGAKWYGHGLRMIADEKTWDLAEKYGALVPQASAPIPEGTFTPGKQEGGELFTEDFLRSTLWFTQAGNNFGRAVTFRAVYDRALPAIARFRQDHNVDVFHRDSGAGKLQEALTKDIEMKAVSDDIPIEDVAGTLARYFVEHTQFPFRKGNAPWPLRYQGGRILGMYGQWSEQFGEYMWRSWRRGTPGERLQWVSRWMVANASTYKFFESMGADVSRWVWTSPAEYSGSVFSSLAADIMGAPNVGSTYGSTARQGLIEAPLNFIPMAQQLKNMAQAMNDPNPLIRMLGFTPIKPKPPFSDEYSARGEDKFVVTPEGSVRTTPKGHGYVYEQLGFDLSDWRIFGSPPGYVDVIQKEDQVLIRLNSETPFEDLKRAARHIDKRAPVYYLDIFQNKTGVADNRVPTFKSFMELMKFVQEYKPRSQITEEFSVNRRDFIKKLSGLLGSTVLDKSILGDVAKFVADPAQAMAKPVTDPLDLINYGVYQFNDQMYVFRHFSTEQQSVLIPFHKYDEVARTYDKIQSDYRSTKGTGGFPTEYLKNQGVLQLNEDLDTLANNFEAEVSIDQGNDTPEIIEDRSLEDLQKFQQEYGRGKNKFGLSIYNESGSSKSIDLKFTGGLAKNVDDDPAYGLKGAEILDDMNQHALDFYSEGKFFQGLADKTPEDRAKQLEGKAIGKYTRRQYLESQQPQQQQIAEPQDPAFDAAREKYLTRPMRPGQEQQVEVMPGVFFVGDMAWANKPETKSYDLIVFDKTSGKYVDTFFSVGPDEDLADKVNERRQVFGWDEKPR